MLQSWILNADLWICVRAYIVCIVINHKMLRDILCKTLKYAYVLVVESVVTGIAHDVKHIYFMHFTRYVYARW